MMPKSRYRLAVASSNGVLVDTHFGQAASFLIYEISGGHFTQVEERVTGKYCLGPGECGLNEHNRETIIEALSDCDAVLSLRIGPEAKEKLVKHGILPMECYDEIGNGLMAAVEVLRLRF